MTKKGNMDQYDDLLLEDVEDDTQEPTLWKVILLNDDYTPRDFVVEMLVAVFHKSPIDATRIMLDVHHKGRGLVGLYPYDIGNTKITQLTRVAREREYPLKAIMEEA